MAALRIFARSAITAIRLPPVTGYSGKLPFPLVDQTHKRWIVTVEVNGPRGTKEQIDLPEFEVTKDPNEWSYVEWCLKEKIVPVPKKENDLPSGWKPPKESVKTLPYYVERTKNHMIPVYLLRTMRGTRRVTAIKRIHGDIMLLEKQLKNYVETKTNRLLGSKINEPAGLIKFRGDFVSHCKNFLEEKGF